MFCRNCGKEIGNSAVCQYCGERDEENSKLNGINIDEQGQFLTAEGRVAFKSPESAMKAYQKNAKAQKVFSMFLAVAFISYLFGMGSGVIGSFFSALGDLVPSFLSIMFSVITCCLMLITGYLLVPFTIGHFVSSAKFPKWIKANNIDCDATIGNKRDRFAFSLKEGQIKLEDVKARRTDTALKGISCILFSILAQIFGVALAFLNIGFSAFSVYLSNQESSFLTEPGVFLIPFMLISMISFLLVLVIVMLYYAICGIKNI